MIVNNSITSIWILIFSRQEKQPACPPPFEKTVSGWQEDQIVLGAKSYDCPDGYGSGAGKTWIFFVEVSDFSL